MSAQRIIELEGAGGRTISITIIKTKVKFSESLIYDVEVGWALIDGVPILLGRHPVFDKFNITFKEREGKIIFEPV